MSTETLPLRSSPLHCLVKISSEILTEHTPHWETGFSHSPPFPPPPRPPIPACGSHWESSGRSSTSFSPPFLSPWGHVAVPEGNVRWYPPPHATNPPPWAPSPLSNLTRSLTISPVTKAWDQQSLLKTKHTARIFLFSQDHSVTRSLDSANNKLQASSLDFLKCSFHFSLIFAT